jgi:hypothetical protein
MIRSILFPLTSLLILAACNQPAKPVQTAEVKKKTDENYIFFLHNKYIEEYGVDAPHPEYGKAEYTTIIDRFKKDGFTVISEVRPSRTDVGVYAQKVNLQIDSLLKLGVPADYITVIGTSKGGYIAQFSSTYLNNPDVNYVFIGAFQESDIRNIPEINIAGNILNIYEKSDEFGVSAVKRKISSINKVTRFKDLELNTGLKHGFLYHPMDEWIIPCEHWARREYDKVK